MIHMPRRSVTRFFIPLIDVLILLFSVYLLLPLASSEEQTRVERTEKERLGKEIERLNRTIERLEEEKAATLPARLREEIERLKKEKAQTLQERLIVRVLEIDGRAGRLFFRKDGREIEIENVGAARQLIDTDRAEQAGRDKELFYLILYPRQRDSEHPTVAEREEFDNWFEGVAKAYDTPNSASGPGGQP